MDTTQQKSFRVLLIGDSCEDEYIYGRCERISHEAPVPVMRFSKLEIKAGMAANICLNLQAFGIDITFLTNSEKLVKTRFIDEKSNRQILRVDNEEKIKPLLLPISTDNFDAVVISDYNKGYLTESKLFEIVEQSSCPVFIDSKKTLLPNKDNCFIKINDEKYQKLNPKNYTDNLIITKGSEGCIFKNTLYPTEQIKVYDVIGAGDVFFAALVYGYLKYNSMDRAIMLGNKASAIAVQYPGTYVLTEKNVNLLCEY